MTTNEQFMRVEHDMKNPLAWIGAVVIAMGVIGATGLADFKLCFGPVGYCNQQDKP